METIIDKDRPEPQILLRGMGIPRHLMIVTWCWAAVVSGLIATSETVFISQVHVFLALYCFSVILLRPFQETPFALLLLSTGPSDILIFFGAILFFLRAISSGKLYIEKRLSGYLFLLFLCVALCSAILSYLSVEFRPLQTVFWTITFLIPLTLTVVNCKHGFDGPGIAKYGIVLITMQILPIIAAIPSYINIGSPDVFGGTWLDADIAGFWGTALMMSSFILLFLGNVNITEKKILLFLITIGGTIAIAASGKIYSVFIVALGLFFFAISHNFIQGLLKGSVRPFAMLLIGIVCAGFVLLLLVSRMDAIQDWAKIQSEYTHKAVFLNRVFNHMDDYGYSDLLGVGPGMLGSRAANSVSSDVLYKEELRLPKILQGAPMPEARIMGGLYDEDFQRGVRHMSANLVIPFSGLGAMKSELGWLGLLSLITLFIAIFWPVGMREVLSISNYTVAVIYIMSTISGLSIIFLSIFDTAWELPKIMIFLSMLMISTKTLRRFIRISV